MVIRVFFGSTGITEPRFPFEKSSLMRSTFEVLTLFVAIRTSRTNDTDCLFVLFGVDYQENAECRSDR